MPGGYYHQPARITHRRGTRINARWFWSVITGGLFAQVAPSGACDAPENSLTRSSMSHGASWVASHCWRSWSVRHLRRSLRSPLRRCRTQSSVCPIARDWRLGAASHRTSGRCTPPGCRKGLALDAAGGEITGRPSGPITAHFTIAVADSGTPPQSATRLFTLRVAQPLALLTAALPPGSYAAPYDVRLAARGGIPPYTWELARGALPPGLRLNRESGVLSGTLATQGDFGFTVRVTDSAKPPQIQTRELSTRIPPPLAVGWVLPPVLNAGGIAGSVQVLNGTRNTVDLTLIVVAVNEYGKAFTLGYQHLPLAPFRYTVEIPFGASLPRGRYTVHADAVSEHAPSVAIHRARLQAGPLVVTSD